MNKICPVIADDLLIDNVSYSQFPKGKFIGWATSDDKNKNQYSMIRQYIIKWIGRIIWMIALFYFLQTTIGLIIGVIVVLFVGYSILRMVLALAYLAVGILIILFVIASILI